MKTLAFRYRKDLVWLHIESILRIHTHRYAVYTETTIISANNQKMVIHDHYQGNFVEFLHEFIASDETLREIKVADMKCDDNYTFFRILDWVSQAMGEK